MLKKILILFSWILFAQQIFAQNKVAVVNFAQLEPMLQRENDTIYVVNFWATWCRPCVAELPFFEELTEKNQKNPLKVVLVSLDFGTQLESKLIPFLRKNKIKSFVVLLSDKNANAWIQKINPSWSGAIPATLCYKGKKSIFHEQEFENFEDLENFVTQLK